MIELNLTANVNGLEAGYRFVINPEEWDDELSLRVSEDLHNLCLSLESWANNQIINEVKSK
jgi:hypothetical protein